MIKKIKLFVIKLQIAIYEYQLKKIAKEYGYYPHDAWEELEKQK